MHPPTHPMQMRRLGRSNMLAGSGGHSTPEQIEAARLAATHRMHVICMRKEQGRETSMAPYSSGCCYWCTSPAHSKWG